MGDRGVERSASLYGRAPHGFVKFFGASDNRVPQSHAVIDEVSRAGCHRACTYSIRPRQVKDGDVIFMARLVIGPDDRRIFGRAIAMEHRPGRDEATPEEISARPFKEHWHFYVRVHDAEFVDGAMRDGVSLSELMDELGAETWASTKRRAEQTGCWDIDPRASLPRQNQLELTPKAIQWANERLERCFRSSGKISPDQLAKLN